MIGVLLVTHGNFCVSLKESTEMVLGRQENLCSLPLNPGDDVIALQGCILNKIRQMDQGEGVIVLVDLFGGSPYNAAASCLKSAHMECLAGMNFPMILGILENREHVKLEELTLVGEQSAVSGIVNVRKKLL